MNEQSDLNAFSDDSEESDKSNRGPRKNVQQLKQLGPDADPSDTLSCPWCCYPPDQFEKWDNGVVGCQNCHSVIPTEAEWYLKGEKIIL